MVVCVGGWRASDLHTLGRGQGPLFLCVILFPEGLPRWLSGKESTCSAGDTGHSGSIPGLGGSPGGGNGNPRQFPCLENPMCRGAWRAIVHRVAKGWTWLKRLCKQWGKNLKKERYMYTYNCLSLVPHSLSQLLSQSSYLDSCFQFPLVATPSPSHLTTANAEGDKSC